MLDYYLINDYIYKVCNKFYLIVKKKAFYAYDYNHNLLSKTTSFKDLVKLQLLNDEEILIHLYNKNKDVLMIWDVMKSLLKEVNYSDFKKNDISNVVVSKDNICVFLQEINSEKNGDYYISCVDKKSLDYDLMKTDNVYSNVFSHNNHIYFENIEYYNPNDEKSLPKSCYQLCVLENNKIKEIIKIDSLYESFFNISDNDKYAFLISTYADEDFMKCYGQLTIFDFKEYCEIDSFKINHMGFYRPIAYFFSLKDNDYIVFQANPEKCSFKKEKWYTYIYSISEKRIIHESKFQLSLRYLSNQKLLLIETNYRKKKTIFCKVDDSLNMEWIIKNLLTSKFLGMKLSKISDEMVY